MSKPQILIVQDNPADIELLQMALDELNEPYEAVVLRDGAEALRYVRSRYNRARDSEPCVILLNLYLPKYDGLDVLRAVKREPNLEHVVVVMVTASALHEHKRAEIERMGAIVRMKPRQITEVTDLARQLLDLCKRAAPAT